MEDWVKTFVADMRAIGVLADFCMGCGKIDCGGCPCGSSTGVDHSKLSPEASVVLKQIFERRKTGAEAASSAPVALAVRPSRHEGCDAAGCQVKACLWRRDSNGYVVEGFCLDHAVEYADAAAKAIVFKDQFGRDIIEASTVHHFVR